jgi:tetratricopeptide (TPR) repeat protein
VTTIALFGGILADGSGDPPTARGSEAVDRGGLGAVESPSTDTEATISRLEARIETQPRDADSLADLGLAWEQRARETADPAYYTRAEDAYRRALAVESSESYTAATGLASVAASRHEFAKGLDLARKAVALRPRLAPAYGILGDALVELGRYRKAFAAFERMASLEPNLSSFARIAYARELLGRPRAALQAFASAVQAGSSSREHMAWALVQTGDLLFETGRLGPAALAYRAALARMPDYLEANGGLARVDAARGRHDAAVGRYRQVVAAAPDAGHAFELADTLHAAGRPREARELYALGRKLLHAPKTGRAPIEPGTIVLELDYGRDLGEALSRARKARTAAPTVHAEDALGWALYRTDRCGEARRHSVRALRLGTLDAQMLFHRGMIERCLGRDAAARDFLRRALAANPYFSLLHAPVAKAVLR